MRWHTSVLFVVAAACSGGGSAHPTDATHDGIPPGCGDGVKMGTEQCDGTDLGSATCGTALAPGWVGVVSCTADCQINIADCSTPPTTYNSETDQGKWSSFDLTTLYPGAKGFIGLAFDGRYMYFSPNNNGAPDGIVARYDTQGGFGSSQSWITFDVATVDSLAKGFQGAAFDGRYVYLIPYDNGTTYDGTIARYDTQAPGGFGASGSWLTFDIATIDPNARGFVRASFDGRYLYLSPYYNGTYDGTIARYDTQGAGLADPGSWSTFDITTLYPNAKGFLGTIFDGRYVYFEPYYNGTAYHGLVLQYDTQDPNGFKGSSAWSTYSLETMSPDAVGFRGVTFDGQYLYFAQNYDGNLMVPVYGGLVARYDTHQAFGAAGAWLLYNVANVSPDAKGFLGATFDGRYVYLAPYDNNVGVDGLVPRYDPQTDAFDVVGSWTTFDTTLVNAGARAYQGAGFDGEFVYFVPSSNGIITRFDAKSPSWLPRGWNAAFN